MLMLGVFRGLLMGVDATGDASHTGAFDDFLMPWS